MPQQLDLTDVGGDGLEESDEDAVTTSDESETARQQQAGATGAAEAHQGVQLGTSDKQPCWPPGVIDEGGTPSPEQHRQGVQQLLQERLRQMAAEADSVGHCGAAGKVHSEPGAVRQQVDYSPFLAVNDLSLSPIASESFGEGCGSFSLLQESELPLTANGGSTAAARSVARSSKKGSQFPRANTAPGAFPLPDFKTPTNISFSAAKVDSTRNTMLKNSRALQMYKKKLRRNSSMAVKRPSLVIEEEEETWHQIQVGCHAVFLPRRKQVVGPLGAATSSGP